MKTVSFVLLIASFMVSGCADHKNTPEAGELNAKASLPADFNFSKMGFKIITSMVNKKSGTMATLYGNDSVKAIALVGNRKSRRTSVFALITWKQQADKRWIGGNIPGDLLSVEMLKVDPDKNIGIYSRFKGACLKVDTDTLGQNARAKYILSLKPSIMF
ncbi:hypothetical protein JN11_03762 [Mucilaginibacter frigoritolerans]|uniref:Cytochrome P460 n=1 Tax=Mucilaginibacter frigoritolerans TaxID=652788 RepID=A0A562TSU0_9SPHI|nr:hypothetical protein [Mucilaginibacter frigoritolerans]TWI96651.1 hypothetical protein JN11_03762 [Mucilaginibacter frigoritolerans]